LTEIAAIGHLTRDVVAGAAPRPGGGVFYAARSLARLGAGAHVAAACAPRDKEALLPALEAFGLPVAWFPSSRTTAYTFHYEGDRRVMWQDAVGDPWTPSRALEAAADAGWVHVAALTRTDFSSAALAALSPGRRLLLDAQGLVRTAALGPLRTDRAIGDVLRHVAMLKLNAEEAETLVGGTAPTRLRSLGVPEILLTLGARGSIVVTSDVVERLPEVAVAGTVDPTGAGDTYAAAYLASRARGADAVEAARVAAATVSSFLSGG
jgi:sugar/nucleoside kinase (ribokinase family)